MRNAKRMSKSLGAGPKAVPRPKGLFSARSAFLTTILLTAFLWWLPVFGQMMAGYVGGRRSGSAPRGLLVAFSAFVSFSAVPIILSYLGVSIMGVQGQAVAALTGTFPAVSEFMVGTFAYIQGMFETLGTAGSGLAAMGLVTVVFGTVGGIVSRQAALELEYRPPASGSNALRSQDACVFASFEDYVAVNEPRCPETVTSGSSSRRAGAFAPPPAPEERSPLSSVLGMSDRRSSAERQALGPKDDIGYI